MASTYESRVYTVEAVRLTDDNLAEVMAWTDGRAHRNGRRLMLRNGSGLEEIQEGDWLVSYGPGKPILKMSDAKFNALYEPAWRHDA
jgi:hypothetical protein